MDPTYELISEQVLTSDQSSVTFSNIPQGYDDLILLTSARLNASGFPAMLMRFNSDSGNKYSYRILEGSGSSVTSTSTSPASSMIVTNLGGTNTTANTFNNSEIYIPSYTSNINKSISSTTVLENNSTTAYIDIISGLWSDTSAITSIQLFPSTASFTSNSSFYLYGIKNADDGTPGLFGPAATGGDEVFTTGNGYKVHVFKNSGTLNVTAPGEVEYLVVGGGGGGSWGFINDISSSGGGGGAGGLLAGNKYLNTSSYPIVVGAGGARNISASVDQGARGSDSLAIGFQSFGGGGGGNQSRGGTNGGSGGGNGNYTSGLPGGAGVPGQGNSGGSTSNVYGGGGGGGAGQPGFPNAGGGGVGGSGLQWPSGSGVFYAGGGGGGPSSSGGSGGGASGGSNNGTASTGGGGGGSQGQSNSGNGGSGIVIIRYRI